MRGHHSLSSLLKLLRDPTRFDEAKYLLRKDVFDALTAVNRTYLKRTIEKRSQDFVTDDWDTMVILDAAKPEFFPVGSDEIKQNFETRTSPASYSYGFMEQEFEGRELHDVVYVTANPYASQLSDGIFHKVIDLYESAWDSDYETVLPESVVTATENARDRHPRKRFIVHFMQPHFPFLGADHGSDIESGLAPPDESGGRHPWNEAMYGSRDEDALVDAYRENHEFALPFAMDVVDQEAGTAVITADHSNLIGERGFPIPLRYYGHPVDFPHPKLTEVPWVELGEHRRETHSDPPVDRDRPGPDVVSDRLRHLGYADQ